MVPLHHLGSRICPVWTHLLPHNVSRIRQNPIRNTKYEKKRRTNHATTRAYSLPPFRYIFAFVFSSTGHFFEFPNSFRPSILSLPSSFDYRDNQRCRSLVHSRKPSPIMASDNSYDWKYYRYDPSLVAALIFIVLFILTASFHLYQLVRTRTWYFIPLVVGGFCTCTCEVPKHIC